MTQLHNQIDDIIEMGRLHLYNQGVPCGPASILVYLAERECHPLPSEYRIKKVLRERNLIYGWTRDDRPEQQLNS